jgi:hypothetical protein
MDLNGRILSRPPPTRSVLDMFWGEGCGTVFESGRLHLDDPYAQDGTDRQRKADSDGEDDGAAGNLGAGS